MNTMDVTHFMKTGMLRKEDSDNLSCELPAHAIEVDRAKYDLDTMYMLQNVSSKDIVLDALLHCLWHLKRVVVEKIGTPEETTARDDVVYIAKIESEQEHWDMKIVVRLYVLA